MRDRFSELIASGVASFHYDPIIPETPSYDPICRQYNNIFSILTDTHMSVLEDGTRVITGHNVDCCPEKLYTIYNSRTGYHGSLANFLYMNGLAIEKGVLNGANVLFVKPEVPAAGPVPMPATMTTSESNIPMNIKFISKMGDIEDVRECFNQPVDKVVESLNASRSIKGNNWIFCGDTIGCEMNDRVYIMKINK